MWPKPAGLAEDDIGLAGIGAAVVAIGARPTIRSSKPSPLTSPAAETLAAGTVACRIALDDEALGGGRGWSRSILCGRSPPALPNTT